MINMGGFLSHIFVMTPSRRPPEDEDDLDTGICVLKKYVTSTKFHVIYGAVFDVRQEGTMWPVDLDEENDVEAILRKIILVSKAIEDNNGRPIPLNVCITEKRDDYFKLIGIREVEDDAGRFYAIYCLTVLDSFGDKEKKVLAELKELVGSELGYVGHMLSPPPSTAEEFLANVKETKELASSSNQLNEKIGYFAGDEMSVKEWVTKLRQTGGSMVSKPELERYETFGTSTADIKETFADGDDDVEEIEPTPELIKTFFQGEIWEYPNWEFHATKEYLFVQFGEDRGAVLQWKEPLDVDPSSLAVGGDVVKTVIENDDETFFL